VKGIPLFVKIRKRATAHGGIGFNPLDFLSQQTVEELQKRRQRILGDKSANELETGKMIFDEITAPKTSVEYLDEIASLKIKIRELEEEVESLKVRLIDIEDSGAPISTSDITSDDDFEDLQTEVKVWKEKYNYLKETIENPNSLPQTTNESNEIILQMQNKTIELEANLERFKSKYTDAILLAEKAISELKKR